MKTDLSSQITLTRIPQRYYRPENAFEHSVLTRLEKIQTNIYESTEEGSFAGLAILIAGDLLQEYHVPLLDKLAAAPRLLRWAAYEVAIFAFLLMGYFLSGGGFLYARY